MFILCSFEKESQNFAGFSETTIEISVNLLQNIIVKKILTIFAIIMVLTTPVFAESQPLLTANFVEVDNGGIVENTLLASDEGNIFIEFSKETKFINAEEKLNFTGEILPPQVIELDIRKPRGLMEELTTFELVSNTGADVAFMDRFDTLTRKNLYREKLLNPDGLSRSSWVKLIYLIDNENTNLPKLWEWQGEEDGWYRVGGNITEAGENSRILSAILRRTGIYTIFDENPAPKHFADEYEVYPKREYTGPYLDEVEPEIGPEDLGVADDYGFSENENSASFHPAGTPPLTEYDIPSTGDSANTQLLQDLQAKITENSAKIEANPEIKGKITNYIAKINKKIENETKEAMLTAEINATTQSLSQATTEEETKNLEATFLELQTSLYELKNEAPNEEEFIALRQEVDDFFAGISAESLSANTFEDPEEVVDRSPPEEDDFYIPENAELTQSGGEESQNISWGFPVFLLVCFGLLGWGIFNTKKKNN